MCTFQRTPHRPAALTSCMNLWERSTVTLARTKAGCVCCALSLKSFVLVQVPSRRPHLHMHAVRPPAALCTAHVYVDCACVRMCVRGSARVHKRASACRCVRGGVGMRVQDPVPRSDAVPVRSSVWFLGLTGCMCASDLMVRRVFRGLHERVQVVLSCRSSPVRLPQGDALGPVPVRPAFGGASYGTLPRPPT